MSYLTQEPLNAAWVTLIRRLGKIDIPPSVKPNPLDPIYDALDAWENRYKDAISSGGRAFSSVELTTWTNALRDQEAAVVRLEAMYPQRTPSTSSKPAQGQPEINITGALPWWYWPLRVGAGIGAGYITYKILRSMDPEPSQPALAGWPKGSRSGWHKNHKLMPGTSVRVYDNGGKTADRYTVIMVGKDWDASARPGLKMSLGMSEGGRSVSMWGEAEEGKHLGKRVRWEDLSSETRRHIESRVRSD